MPETLRDFRVLGVHPVHPPAALFEETLRIQWGSDLTAIDLEHARQSVGEHFAGLYLFEVQLEPFDADIDWGEVTQPDPGQPRSNWQVAYDERPIDETAGRWAFFLHFVDLGQPLQTPVGARALPAPSPVPSHLADCSYEVP